MKITRTEPIYWFSTVEIFEPLTPQPEVGLIPISQQARLEIWSASVTIKMVPHPTKPGEFLPYEYPDKVRFTLLLFYAAIKGLKHFEDAQGRSLEATQADIDYLLANTPDVFHAWLQERITALNAQVNAELALKKETALKN